MSRRISARNDAQIEREMDRSSNRSNIMPNDYRFNRSYPNLYPLRLQSFEQGQTTVRIWPMLDPRAPDTRLLPGRVSAADTAGLGGLSITDTLVAPMVGLRDPNKPSDLAGTSVCSYIIAPLQASEIFGIPVREEPYMLLQRTAHNAKKQADKASPRGGWSMHWSAYVADLDVPGRQMKTKMTPYPKKQFFAVCSIFENGPDMNTHSHKVKQGTEKVTIPRQGFPFGWKPEDPLYLLELGSSAVQNLFYVLSQFKDGVTGATQAANPADLFKAGEPAGIYNPADGTLRGGKFITFYNAKYTPQPLNIGNNYLTSMDLPKRAGQQEMGAQYQAAVSDMYVIGGQPIGPDVPPEQTRMIFEKHGYFYSSPQDETDETYMLELLSIEERCEILAKAYAADPAFLEFGWRERPEYSQFDSVQAIFRARTSVPMSPPGYAQQPGYQQQPAYPPQSGYAQQPGYQQQLGYPQQPGYQQQPSYPPQSAYQPPPGYQQQPAYQPPGYPQQPAYPPQAGQQQQPLSFDQMSAMMPPPATAPLPGAPQSAAAILQDFAGSQAATPQFAPPVFAPAQPPPAAAQPFAPAQQAPVAPTFSPPQVAQPAGQQFAPPPLQPAGQQFTLPQFVPPTGATNPAVGVPTFAGAAPNSALAAAAALPPGAGVAQPPWSGGEEEEVIGDEEFDMPGMDAALGQVQALLQPNRRTSPPPA